MLRSRKVDGTLLDSVTITATSFVEVELVFICSNATTDKIQLDNLASGEIVRLDDFVISRQL